MAAGTVYTSFHTTGKPCACRTGSNGAQGNSQPGIPGQFEEKVVVWSQPGEDWTLLETAGFYSPFSPAPPALPEPLSPGMPMTELLPGKYELSGIHTDGQGYSVLVSNGTDTLSISNLCHYPSIAIENLPEGICLNNPAMELIGQSNGTPGAGTFSIWNANGQLIQALATTVDPALLGEGDFIVHYTFDQAPDSFPCTFCMPGCVQVAAQPVTIEAGMSGIACNDLVQIALPGTCMQEILPDMVLEGDLQSNVFYEVELFNGINALGNTVDINHIGMTLTVQVTNTCNGISCWGTLTVSDQWAPEFDCPEEPIILYCGQDVDAVPPPILTDNCDTGISPTFLGEITESPGCGATDGVWEKIFRQWGGEDAWGNIAAPCTQQIHLLRGTLDEVVFPPHLNGFDAPALDCSNPDASPQLTGFPTLNGVPFGMGSEDICAISAYYADLTFPGCGATQKMIRTWTVWDACLPSTPGVNPLTYTQAIWVVDDEPPVIVCPVEITANLLSISCDGPVELPSLEASDNCSAISFSVETPAGFIAGNGGVLEGLVPGPYAVVYKATDACGNVAACEVALQVVDGVAPVAICDEYTVISLDADGVAELPAADLDDGSYDGCTEVSFLVRRLDIIGDYFAPWVAFNCADVKGGPVPVELQVSDAYGNTGTCMVSVDVQDKTAPLLECPPAVTLDCSQDPVDLTLTGELEVFEACLVVVGWSDMDLSSNFCGWGDLVRTFKAVDASGNSSTCQQFITILSEAPFDITGITWPEDVVFTDCTTPEYFHPDSLPEYAQRPVFDDHPCALVATNYEDAYFDIAAPACFKILRTWRVIDWCQYDPGHPEAGGYWEHVQVLKVEDHTPPVLFCAFSSFVKVLSPNCVETVTLPQPGVMDCSPDVEISVESPLGEGFGPFPNVPLGAYPVTYTVTDHCGNISVCSYTLQVVDAKKPTPVCENGVVVELMQTGMVTVNISTLNEGSYDNCTAQEDLIISFSPYNPADTTLFIDCSTPAGLVVQVWVTDEFGNADYCQTLVLVQDNMGVCPGVPLTLAGGIETEAGGGVNEVWVELNDGSIPGNLTDSSGSFVLTGLEAGADYTVIPEKDQTPLNGVTTYDMVLISRHILGTQLLDSPYKIIAADVNRSNTVSTMDLVELRKLILFQISEFSNNTSWRFVDMAFSFPDPVHPFQTPFPEVIHYNNISAGMPPPFFVAIKVGDVNLSATSY
ncbi:MAG: hypothetical protein IPJ40_06255 [Saprospirales bacterium]|nr:hypothetical protein [Saprospirales bacterium]